MEIRWSVHPTSCTFDGRTIFIGCVMRMKPGGSYTILDTCEENEREAAERWAMKRSREFAGTACERQ